MASLRQQEAAQLTPLIYESRASETPIRIRQGSGPTGHWRKPSFIYEEATTDHLAEKKGSQFKGH